MLGNQLALAGDWEGARARYAQVCRQNVRVGCENLVHTYSHDGGDQAQAMLQQICDDNPRNVACDVAQTTDWAMLGLNQALQETLQEIERELPDEEGAGDH